MARQRVLKPGFNDDNDMAALTHEARLFYALIWGWLDKQSLIEENPLGLRSKLYPLEDFPISKVEGWITELVNSGPSGRPRLIRIKWRGKNLLYCPTLKRHSRIFADEAESFKVPEALLKEAREARNVFIDEKGEPTDPPPTPPAGGGSPGSPPASHGDATGLPLGSHVGPTEGPRGSHEGPTEQPPNSHDSSSVSAPASVQVSSSAVASVPASSGSAPVDKSRSGVDKSKKPGENVEIGPARGAQARDGPVVHDPELAEIIDFHEKLQARKADFGAA